MSLSDALEAVALLVSGICGNNERRTIVTVIASPRRLISA